MWKNLLLWVVCVFISSVVQAQTKQYYTVEGNDKIDKLFFALDATSGNCFLRPTYDPNPISIYGKSSKELNPEFDININDNHQYVKLDLQEKESKSLSQTISYKMFSAEGEMEENNWNIYFTRNKPINLDLNYGVGNAYVDLSGLSIENLKINTASADVHVMYHPGQINRIEMDTLAVTVDLGKLMVQRCNLSKARQIIADVGFGSLYLDFSEKALVQSTITASVGAGRLEILVPDTDTPIIINVSNSPLCHVRLAKSFKEIRPNVFVNSSYGKDVENLLTFNLDVAMGHISFKVK